MKKTSGTTYWCVAVAELIELSVNNGLGVQCVGTDKTDKMYTLPGLSVAVDKSAS